MSVYTIFVQFKIPEQYIVSKFFQYTGFPVYKPVIRGYNASCPVCKEGNSWGKKKRLFYFPHKEQLFCHNCSKGWTPASWLKQVCNLTINDIRAEIGTGAAEKPVLDINTVANISQKKYISALPEDSINLFDRNQIEFYKENIVVRKALQMIKQRRLHTAVNRPKSLFISLKDYIHKNRLCIPFYDFDGRIVFYQTRKLLNEDGPKYLSKLHEEKAVFGINNIDANFPYIFVLEGPIDAMFIKNGVAVCGTTMTKKQLKQLQQLPTHEIIWCLDNQHVDATSAEKTKELIKSGFKVFQWPKHLIYKDLNEWCVDEKLNEIDCSFILNNLSSNNLLAALSAIKL